MRIVVVVVVVALTSCAPLMVMSEQSDIAPSDARIDAVWKAVPALDGREVDAIATRRTGRTVYRRVPPRVTLADVQPSPIYRGHPEKSIVALMINVAWHEERLPAMLDILRTRGVLATFFVLGSWAHKHPSSVQRIDEMGHEIANHAYTHRNMSSLSAHDQGQEIARTAQLLTALGVHPSPWFAPPSGDYNEETVRVAWAHGVYTVLWSVDTVDWREPHEDVLVQRVMAHIHAGALVLMHPTTAAVLALPTLIDRIRARGLRIGTVSDVLSSTRTDTD
jgi:probable sporulation protein (polysaccharide deacetylase family)